MSNPRPPPRKNVPTLRRRPPRRVVRPKPSGEVSALQARWQLLTYAISRLPPRQLPMLAGYAYIVQYLAQNGWIPSSAVGKAGGSVVGVLSMAVSKWEEGKKIWVEVRTSIRDGIRLISTEKDTERTGELAGLLVGFAFALQHHLHGTRALPQPPLCDLLPAAYIASLKRTDARVRFADNTALDTDDAPDSPRPGLRRRFTGPPMDEARDDWDTIRDRAEDAVTRLADAVTGEDVELRKQLAQLQPDAESETAPPPVKQKSNLATPVPPNLPLVLLKLMEVYMNGLEWTDAKRDRALGIVKSLSGDLGQAERLASNPPPLPLTLHFSHVLAIYLAALPCSLLCVVSGWALVLVSLIAGWCLLGLEALVEEVGGVFGGPDHPQLLPTRQILGESLDICPTFLAYYRARLVARLGPGDAEVAHLDRKRGEEWTPF